MGQTDQRESDLLTILRGDQPWEQKRDALAAFPFAQPPDVDPRSDDWAVPILPNTAMEFYLAMVDGLVTYDQYHEALVVMEQESKGGKTDKPAADKAGDKPAAEPVEESVPDAE